MAAGGVLVTMFLTFNAAMGVVFTMKALIVVIMGGVGNLLGALVAGLLLGLAETPVARSVDPGLTLAVTYALFLAVLLVRPTGLFGRAARDARIASWRSALVGFAAARRRAALVGDGYQLALGISILNYTVLATAWALFSGPTHYISLATVAFFGIGAYTVAVLGETLPWPLVLLIAAVDRRRGRAGGRPVDAAALRHLLRHLHLRPGRTDPPARDLVRGQHHPLGRPLHLPRYHRRPSRSTGSCSRSPCWCFARRLADRALAARAWRCASSATTRRWRAMSASTRRGAKLALFAISAAFMTLTGAVMAPRWTYIDPAIAFNPMISFQVVIMALLGGAAPAVRAAARRDAAGAAVRSADRATSRTISHPARPASSSLIVYCLPRGVVGAGREQPAATPGGTPRAGGRMNAVPVARSRRPAQGFGGLVAVDDLSFVGRTRRDRRA